MARSGIHIYVLDWGQASKNNQHAIEREGGMYIPTLYVCIFKCYKRDA